MAIDFTSEGEFDLYLTDTDANGIYDYVRYYKDNSDELTYGSESGDKVLEECLTPCLTKLATMLQSKWDAATLSEALKVFKTEICAALNDWHKKITN